MSNFTWYNQENSGAYQSYGGLRMENEKILYICPVCFQTCESETECHAHKMIECNLGHFGDERRKPVIDNFGNMVSRAPRWYLEAVGWISVGQNTTI